MDIPVLDTGYVPGVCNIGKQERAMRFRFGWISLAVAVVLAATLVAFRADWWWRLFVFLPAAGAAAGILHGVFRFCIGFARMGVFNFGAKVGTTTSVEDEEARKKDSAKMRQMNLLIVLCAGVFTALAVLL